MPVSVLTAADPFRTTPTPIHTTPSPAEQPLRKSQVRILLTLKPSQPNIRQSEWPVLTRTVIQTKAGYSPTNSLNRLLNGSPTQPGLISMGLIEIVIIDIDGKNETNYRITHKGIQCLSLERSDAQ